MKKAKVFNLYTIFFLAAMYGLYALVAWYQLRHVAPDDYFHIVIIRLPVFLFLTGVGASLFTGYHATQKRMNTVFSLIAIACFLYSSYGAVQTKIEYIDAYKQGYKAAAALEEKLSKPWLQARLFMINDSFDNITTIAADDNLYQEHRKNTENYISLSKDYRAFLARQVEITRQKLEKLNISLPVRNHIIEFIDNKRKKSHEIMSQLLPLHVAAGTAFLDLLDWLHNSRQDWQIKDDNFLFSNEAAQQTFQEKAETPDKIQEEIVRLSAQLRKLNSET